MKCFYHNDVDGKCAGAIVKKHWDESNNHKTRASYISINYDVNFPLETVDKDEKIFIVDFSLSIEDFMKLYEITKRIVWIDHHITAIEKYKLCPIRPECIEGVRENGKAGCELTWEYLRPATTMPLSVKYAGRYDVWDFSEFGETLNVFQAGVRLERHDPESETWINLLGDNHLESLVDILRDGEIALKFRTNRYASMIKAFSFYAEFEGLRAICCNVGATSSQLFDSVDESTYDIMIPFVASDRGWTLSLYAKKDIDCSEIAKKYGGGGHKKAAGFQCKQLFFKDGKIEVIQ